MANETTPSVITEEIKHLCGTIQPSTIPFFVEVYPFQGMQINECFPNVKSVVEKLGGTTINGWAIWQWANIMVEAEAHAIWQAPDGKFVDITPHINNETCILFLPDDQVRFNGNPIPSHRQALTNSPLVAELISLFNKRDTAAATTPGKVYSISNTDLRRMLELQQLFHRSAERNDPCPCGSGLKYKKCCGRHK
mgnify:CR=1 FL=1